MINALVELRRAVLISHVLIDPLVLPSSIYGTVYISIPFEQPISYFAAILALPAPALTILNDRLESIGPDVSGCRQSNRLDEASIRPKLFEQY